MATLLPSEYMRCVVGSLDAAEAFSVILKHEKIEFTIGLEPNGLTPFFISLNDKERLEKAMREWWEAMNKLRRVVPEVIT